MADQHHGMGDQEQLGNTLVEERRLQEKVAALADLTATTDVKYESLNETEREAIQFGTVARKSYMIPVKDLQMYSISLDMARGVTFTSRGDLVIRQESDEAHRIVCLQKDADGKYSLDHKLWEYTSRGQFYWGVTYTSDVWVVGEENGYAIALQFSETTGRLMSCVYLDDYGKAAFACCPSPRMGVYITVIDDSDQRYLLEMFNGKVQKKHVLKYEHEKSEGLHYLSTYNHSLVHSDDFTEKVYIYNLEGAGEELYPDRILDSASGVLQPEGVCFDPRDGKLLVRDGIKGNDDHPLGISVFDQTGQECLMRIPIDVSSAIGELVISAHGDIVFHDYCLETDNVFIFKEKKTVEAN